VPHYRHATFFILYSPSYWLLKVSDLPFKYRLLKCVHHSQIQKKSNILCKSSIEKFVSNVIKLTLLNFGAVNFFSYVQHTLAIADFG